MSHEDTLRVFHDLKPGDRIELVQEIRVGFRQWNSTTTGTVVRIDRRRDSLHFRRNFDDKVFADLIVLKRDSGELTTVALDEFCELRRLD